MTEERLILSTTVCPSSSHWLSLYVLFCSYVPPSTKIKAVSHLVPNEELFRLVESLCQGQRSWPIRPKALLYIERKAERRHMKTVANSVFVLENDCGPLHKKTARELTRLKPKKVVVVFGVSIRKNND